MWSPPLRLTLLGAVLTCVAVLASACGDAESSEPLHGPEPETVSAATLEPGEPIALPAKKDVALRIKRAGNPNSGEDLLLSIDQLDAMGTVALHVDDRDGTGDLSTTFTGPRLSTVLEYADVTGSTLHTNALNDYRIDIPMADATDIPTIIATRQDGARISVERNGPLRIIYPQEGWNIDQDKIATRLVWMLTELDVS